jgi:hypothetical protein
MDTSVETQILVQHMLGKSHTFIFNHSLQKKQIQELILILFLISEWMKKELIFYTSFIIQLKTISYEKEFLPPDLFVANDLFMLIQ